jgi:isochorismate synthase
MIYKELPFNIDELISSGRSFAMFRLPCDNELSFLIEDADRQTTTAYDIDWLNGRRGFVVAPFRCTAFHPLLLINPDTTGKADLECIHDNAARTSDAYTLQPEEFYSTRFNKFVEALSDGNLHKLVLSRKLDVACPGDIDVKSVFLEACRRYLYSYVYMFHTQQTGVWIGSTPEILLSGEKGEWLTMSLAGTQAAPHDGSTSARWDEKNIREQSYVSDYLRSCLSSYGITTVESKPRTVRAGELVHLRTDFNFHMQDSGRIGSLLKAIHPTPAVCGLPKEEAYRFILDNEGYDRGYYSGFIGMIEPDGETNIFVNLRCMSVIDNYATLYAGGGILTSSSLNDEWLETERKMATMKRIIISK